MDPNWLGVFFALLAIAAFSVAYRYGRKLEFKRRAALVLLSMVLALPGASFAIYYAHLFPESSGYYQFRSVPGTEVLIVFIGICGGLFAALLPRIFLTLPLLFVVVFVLVPFSKPFMGPIPKGRMTDLWNGEVCLQSTSSTCGAASGATILKALGVEATESQLAAEAHSYMGGTEAWYLARALRKRGVTVRFRHGEGLETEVSFPAIAGVRLGKVGHFIAILGKEGELFQIGDPLRGEESLAAEDLLKRYEFTGFYMEVGRVGK